MAPTLGVAAVAGFPVRLSPGVDQSNLLGRPFEDDWVVLMADRNRFKPNKIDAAVELHADQLVVIAGFRRSRPVLDAKWHVSRVPEYVVGRIASRHPSANSPSIVKVDVPLGEYHGFSGSPAAIVDMENHIRVWGVVVGGSTFRDVLPPWRRHQLVWIARLPASRMPMLQDSKLLNPTEFPVPPPRAGQSDAIDEVDSFDQSHH